MIIDNDTDDDPDDRRHDETDYGTNDGTHRWWNKARREVSDRELGLSRERKSMIDKTKREASLEKDEVSREFDGLREEKGRLDGLNQELNARATQVVFTTLI